MKDSLYLDIEGFKDRLKEAIGDTPIQAFARKCSCADSVMRKYLTGQSLPGLEILCAISAQSGVSIDWLAMGRGPKNCDDQASQGSTSINPAILTEALKIVLEYYKDRNKIPEPGNVAEVAIMIYEAVASEKETPLLKLLKRDVS